MTRGKNHRALSVPGNTGSDRNRAINKTIIIEHLLDAVSSVNEDPFQESQSRPHPHIAVPVRKTRNRPVHLRTVAIAVAIAIAIGKVRDGCNDD